MERRVSMVKTNLDSGVRSCLSNEEEAASLLWISSKLPAAHSVGSWTNSFLAPDHQRSVVGRLLDEHGTEFSSEQAARTWDDEQCFERIMWSVKEISSELSTASYEDPFNRCQLSESWFQQDARQYDEQQKKQAPKEQMQLLRLEDVEDLHEKYGTKSFGRNQKRRTHSLQAGEGRRVRPKSMLQSISAMGPPSIYH